MELSNARSTEEVLDEVIRRGEERLNRRQRRRRLGGSSAVALLLIVGAGFVAQASHPPPGRRYVVSASSGDGPATTSTAPAPVEDPFSAAPGYRIPVGGNTPETENLRGYVNWEAIGGRTPQTPRINAIYAAGGPSSDEGAVIGHWATGVGWITIEQYADPAFDYESLLAEARERDAEYRQQEGISAPRQAPPS